ncbi:MAG: phosphatidylglycerol lysyltransferase domain-containing protein [Actinobacteria bacterium]|nr:phosphatidylglycerol lysyltransferase domain-containing protein [Actinomycetota bacterium]
MKSKSVKSAPFYLSWVLIAQSLSIIGFLSTRTFPHFVRIVGSVFTAPVFRGSEITAVIASTAILLTARAVRLRRRRAWIVATILQGVLILNSIFHGLIQFVLRHKDEGIAFRTVEISHLISELVIFLLLIYFRKEFKTKSDIQTVIKSVFFLIQISLLSFFVGLTFVGLDKNSFTVKPNYWQILEITSKGIFGISSSVQYVSTYSQDRTEYTLGSLGLLIVILSSWQFFKPNRHNSHIDTKNLNEIRTLLSRYPEHDSLSYFALRENKNFIWSKNAKAVIPYSVINGVMITTGDPIGDRESWPSAMSAFCVEAEDHAWIPAIYGCTEEAGLIWTRETGFESLEIGDEAVLLVDNFTLEGPEMKNVRQMVNQIKRKDYSTSIKKISDIDTAELNKLSKLSDQWRRGGSERGFSMTLGRFCDPTDPHLVIALAIQNGEPMGMLQFIPWGNDGLSLDSMRRSPNSDPGINELLISETAAFARENGIKQISLNFATFRSIFEKGERLGASPFTRLSHKVLIFFSRFFQMESLYRFNAKFRPIWTPRYILFPTISRLMRVAIAILMIESFIPIPQVAKQKK